MAQFFFCAEVFGGRWCWSNIGLRKDLGVSLLLASVEDHLLVSSCGPGTFLFGKLFIGDSIYLEDMWLFIFPGDAAVKVISKELVHVVTFVTRLSQHLLASSECSWSWED